MTETIKSAFWIVLYLCTVLWMQNRDIEDTQYREGLEKVAARCTGRTEQVIYIDGEAHLVSAVPIGAKP